MTPLRAAQDASGRAFAVSQGAEALRDALEERVKSELEAVLEASRRAQQTAQTFQLYGAGERR